MKRRCKLMIVLRLLDILFLYGAAGWLFYSASKAAAHNHIDQVKTDLFLVFLVLVISAFSTQFLNGLETYFNQQD